MILSSTSTVPEAAAPLIVCSGCQLLDTIQFCSTDVYSRLVTEMRRQSSKFYFHPNDCMAAAVDLDISSTGPDCMPPPQGLASEIGELFLYTINTQVYGLQQSHVYANRMQDLMNARMHSGTSP